MDARILELFEHRGNWTASAVARELKVSRQSVRHNLEKLVSLGHLRRHHVDRVHLHRYEEDERDVVRELQRLAGPEGRPGPTAGEISSRLEGVSPERVDQTLAWLGVTPREAPDGEARYDVRSPENAEAYRAAVRKHLHQEEPGGRGRGRPRRPRARGAPSTVIYNRGSGMRDLRPVFLDLLSLLQLAKDQQRDRLRLREETEGLSDPYHCVPDPLSGRMLPAHGRMDLGDVLVHREAVRFISRVVEEFGVEDLFPLRGTDDRWKEPTVTSIRVHTPVTGGPLPHPLGLLQAERSPPDD